MRFRQPQRIYWPVIGPVEQIKLALKLTLPMLMRIGTAPTRMARHPSVATA